jgi:hypothetical protein
MQFGMARRRTMPATKKSGAKKGEVDQRVLGATEASHDADIKNDRHPRASPEGP